MPAMKGSTISRAVIAAFFFLTALFAAEGAAEAACFESGVGCTNDHYMSKKVLNTLSCDILWTVRNTIFDENGYCFKTERALETFSNQGCYIKDAGQLKMNAYERANLDRIVTVERSRGCR